MDGTEKLNTGKATLRGYVFTLDTIFAALILVSFAAVLATLTPKADTATCELGMQRQAHDILAVMDKGYVLNSLDQDQIRETLDKAFPEATEWRMRVDYYKNDSTLAHQGSFEISRNEDSLEEGRSVSATRIFVIIRDDVVANFGVAKLSLWRGN